MLRLHPPRAEAPSPRPGERPTARHAGAAASLTGADSARPAPEGCRVVALWEVEDMLRTLSETCSVRATGGGFIGRALGQRIRSTLQCCLRCNCKRPYCLNTVGRRYLRGPTCAIRRTSRCCQTGSSPSWTYFRSSPLGYEYEYPVPPCRRSSP